MVTIHEAAAEAAADPYQHWLRRVVAVLDNSHNSTVHPCSACVALAVIPERVLFLLRQSRAEPQQEGAPT